MSRLTGLFISLALAALAGCQTLDERKQETALDEQVRFYVRAIRWGELDAAASMIRPRPEASTSSAAPPAAVPAPSLDGLRVTAYEVQVEDRTEGSAEARMVARFSYYFENSVVVRNVTNEGVWWYDATAERWFLEGALPSFTR